jgi:hypothetical protein
METLSSLMLSLVGSMAQTLLMSMVRMSTEFMIDYYLPMIFFHTSTPCHMLCQQISALHLQWLLFIADLVKFDQTKFLELMLADNQSYNMSKFANVNPFPVSRMCYEPLSHLTPSIPFVPCQKKM